jgi:hypothetical protein
VERVSRAEGVRSLVEAVNEQVARVIGAAPYAAWVADQTLKEGDLVVFNNSFLYRPGMTGTTKSMAYLCVTADREGIAKPSAAVLISPSVINVRFRRVPARRVAEYEIVDLAASVEAELGRLGVIVLALVGRIGEDEPATVPLRTPEMDSLRYAPQQEGVAIFDGRTISVNRLDDIDVVWRAVEIEAERVGIETSDSVVESFEDALAALLEEAGRPVNIDDVAIEGPSILGDVVARLDEQIVAYEKALAGHVEVMDDPDALSELLRIAYNFADGLKALTTLLVGVSDLKPLMFWLTVSEQSSLADEFSNLPFALVGKAKPSLDRYRSVIAGARNRAFHDLFSFGRPFHVRLTGEAFREAQLRLFRDYARRREPALHFEDSALIGLLEGFTRAPERQVPVEFWQENLGVIRAVAAVARAMQVALVSISEALQA